MPIFEYECVKCGKHTEHLQLSSAGALSECPHCGGAVSKLMSAPAFQFKGSGWYVTDYADKGKASEKAGGNGAEKASAGEGEASAAGESSSSDKSSGSGTAKTSPAKSSSAKTSTPSD